MAPALQGRHKDLNCPQCGFLYRTGTTADLDGVTDTVDAVTCPMCFYTEQIDPRNPQHVSHSGDRILVNKFSMKHLSKNRTLGRDCFQVSGQRQAELYQTLDWLPHETVRIRHGDIYVQSTGDGTRMTSFALPESLSIRSRICSKMFMTQPIWRRT